MDGAARKITDHVRAHFPALRQRRSSSSSSSSKRALLVLDGCKRQVFVGQVRVSLKDLLKSLRDAFGAIGVSLTAAVTMRETGPAEPGRVGILGEEIVVVKALDARRCERAFPVMMRFFFRRCVLCVCVGGGGWRCCAFCRVLMLLLLPIMI